MLRATQQGKIRRINLSECIIPEYQRSYIKNHALTVNEFRRDAMGFPLVSERNGFMFIIDGQQRRAALMRAVEAGGERPYASVEYITGLTEAQEEDLFAIRNRDAKKVTARDLFKADLSVGVWEAEQIQKIADNAGYDTIRLPIAAVRESFNGDSELTARTITVLGQAFGTSATIKQRSFEGATLALSKMSAAMDDALVLAIQQEMPTYEAWTTIAGKEQRQRMPGNHVIGAKAHAFALNKVAAKHDLTRTRHWDTYTKLPAYRYATTETATDES